MSLAAQRLSQVIVPFGVEKISAALQQLGPQFANRAVGADAQDRFVAENFAELKAYGLVAAGVPEELGGLGASQAKALTCEPRIRLANERGRAQKHRASRPRRSAKLRDTPRRIYFHPSRQ